MRRGVLSAALLLVLAALALLLALPAAAPAVVGDWKHAWQVVQLVNLQRPAGPVIYYLGDSTARESTADDAGWTAQLRRRAANAGKMPHAAVYTLAAHGQTFGMDAELVRALPPVRAGGPRGIVVIGVGLSRFIGPPAGVRRAAVAPPPAGKAPELDSWYRHLYTTRWPLPLTRKEELVPRWMDRRWAGFRQNRRANLHAIARVVSACRAKGLRPVLLDLPLDLRVVGHGLDRARRSYRSGCRRLARRHDVTYLSLSGPPLPSSDYWDLMHLLPPGSATWQSRVTRALVGLLPKAGPSPTRFGPPGR